MHRFILGFLGGVFTLRVLTSKTLWAIAAIVAALAATSFLDDSVLGAGDVVIIAAVAAAVWWIIRKVRAVNRADHGYDEDDDPYCE